MNSDARMISMLGALESREVQLDRDITTAKRTLELLQNVDLSIETAQKAIDVVRERELALQHHLDLWDDHKYPPMTPDPRVDDWIVEDHR